jgi:hypothetical protein
METGKTLIDFWSWAADKGVMNKNTAAGLRSACIQVLGVADDPAQVDIASLDVEDFLNRFQNLRKQRFKPQVLEAYKRRFRNAVKSYKEYIENPGTWKSVSQDRSGGADRRQRASNASAPSTGSSGGVSRSRAGLSAVGCEEYPFPLRPGVMARLILPVDITRDEARRIKAFVDMLVVGNGNEGSASMKQE